MANQVELGSHKILEAIGEAAKELEWLQQRAGQIREFIILGKRLLGEEVTDELVVATGGTVAKEGYNEVSDTSQNYTVADWARKYLEEVERPMKVPEISKALVDRGWVTSAYATEVIRAAMARRDDVFERVALGVYALKAWPPAMKRLSQGASRAVAHHRQRSSRQQETLPMLVYAALRELGKPSDFRQILERIEANGHKVNRTSLLRAIYRSIEGRRLFDLIAPGIFGLLEWQRLTREQQPVLPLASQEGERRSDALNGNAPSDRTDEAFSTGSVTER